MSFFYDLNKKLDSIRATPEVTHKQLNERDEGKPGKNFAKIAKDAGERYGSKAAGERVAGSIRNKLRDQGKLEEQQVDEKVDVYHRSANADWADLSKNTKNPNDPRAVAHRKSAADAARAARAAGDLKFKGQSQYTDIATTGQGAKVHATRSPKDVQEGGGPAAAPAKSMVDKSTATAGRTPPYVPTNTRVKPEPKDNGMGRIVQGTWQADPKGKVPAPSGDPEGVKEAGMTPKQRSFAKLAPPVDKITFADKIAGAKKEVDEMLGDVAAEAMRSALGGGRGRNAEMDENSAPGGFGPAEWAKVSKLKARLMAKGMEPEDAEQEAAERLGFDYEEMLDYLDSMNEEKSKGTAFDMSAPRQVTPKVGSVERGHKHDIKHTATGRVVTRRVDPQGNSVGADDESDAQAAPRGRGRPKGTKGAIGAKGPSGRSKLMTKEGDMDVTDQGEYDQEGDMAKGDIKTIVRHAQALYKILGDNDNLPEWVQSKLAKVESMMVAVDEYMQNQDSDEEAIAEEPRSKNQAVAARIARGVQKGTAKAKPGSASAEMAKMQPKELNKFAKGSTKGLPKKVSKNKAVDEADENYENGKLTTTRTGPGQSSTSSSTGRVNATIGNGKVTVKPGKPMDDDTDTASVSNKESNKDTSSSKSNGMVGKGIYDSMNRELELMIAESMSVNMSDSTEGNKSLTVTATDDDAMKLAMILKSAGLGGSGGNMHSHGEEACDTCGMQDCGCGDVEQAIDENAPDWPTNTEQADNNFGYSGGLNKPKSSGIATGSVTDVSMAGEDQFSKQVQRMREMAGIQNEEHVDLGPPDPETAHMTPDEVDAALYLGSDGSHADMTPDEVNAAFKAGSGPAPDEVYGGGSNNPPQYEDSIQRMREMAGIKEAKKATRDWDNDGNIESGPDEHAGSVDKAIKKAQAEKKVDESIFALTNQWRAYKG